MCSGCYIACCVNVSLGSCFIVHNPQVRDGLGKSNHPDTFPPVLLYRVRSNSLNAAKLHNNFGFDKEKSGNLTKKCTLSFMRHFITK